jgi:hypothetical protein
MMARLSIVLQCEHNEPSEKTSQYTPEQIREIVDRISTLRKYWLSQIAHQQRRILDRAQAKTELKGEPARQPQR